MLASQVKCQVLVNSQGTERTAAGGCVAQAVEHQASRPRGSRADLGQRALVPNGPGNPGGDHLF